MNESRPSLKPMPPLKFGTLVACPPKKATVTVEVCMDQFVEANALGNRKSACYECRHGDKTRRTFAQGVDNR